MSESPASELGKAVLITGAAGGMGANHARSLAGHGWHVHVADIADASDVAAKIQSDGGQATAHHLDVTDPQSWADVVTAIGAEGHGLHGLVNNAGVSKRVHFMQTSNEDWRRILSINLDGPFYGIKACAELLRDSGGGSIVNISSIAGQIGYFAPAYSASKWGLRGVTKSAAGELAAWNIRVNSIHPGLVETPLLAGADAFITNAVASIPAGRMGQPSEITSAVEFLLGEESKYMTGAELTIDGGLVSNGLYHRIITETGADLS